MRLDVAAGLRVAGQALFMSVRVAPGPTPFTRMPRSAYSSARVAREVAQAALADGIGDVGGLGNNFMHARAVQMMPPPGRDRKWRMAAWAQRSAPVRFTSEDVAVLASGASWLGAGPGCRVVDEDVQTLPIADHPIDHGADGLAC